MALTLTDVALTPPATTVTIPLHPVIDPETDLLAVLTVAGVKLAIVSRGGGAETYVLARFRSARAASHDYSPAIPARDGKPAVKAIGKPAREEGWTPTARVVDIARAITGGLLA